MGAIAVGAIAVGAIAVGAIAVAMPRLWEPEVHHLPTLGVEQP